MRPVAMQGPSGWAQIRETPRGYSVKFVRVLIDGTLSADPADRFEREYPDFPTASRQAIWYASEGTLL